MKFRMAAPKLESLDELRGECLVLACFAEDRPLRGLGGLVDWRLNGQLSKLLLRDFVDGHFLEATLLLVAQRLPFERVLLVGLGKRSEFNAARFEESCRFIFAKLTALQASQFAMVLPGRVGFDVGLRQALAGWRRAVIDAFGSRSHDAVALTLLEPPDLQKELLDPFAQLEKELLQMERELAKAAPATAT